MATWDTIFETSPANGDNPSEGAGKIRELKVETGDRGNREHTWAGTTAADGIHRAGSAKVYFTTATPTLQPDGTTALTTTDKGRLYWRSSARSSAGALSSGNVLLVHNGTGFVSTAVSLSNAQTIHGVKTFHESPRFSSGFLPSPSGSYAIKERILSIGTWNLQTTASKRIDTILSSAGITTSSVLGVNISLVGDNGRTALDNSYWADGYGHSLYNGTTNLLTWWASLGGGGAGEDIQTDWYLVRKVTNSPTYTNWDGSGNRGWLCVTYH